jgi:molybdopterin synthase catalytic subunit/molybdopterin converting factor small subunit
VTDTTGATGATAATGATGVTTVSVRLFAILRERAGTGDLALELPAGATVADALAELRRLPGLGETLERIEVATAVNREWSDPSTPLEAGDELALIPPVSGGAGGTRGTGESVDVHVRVTSEPLQLDPLARMVVRDPAGAIVSFQGVTREVERLDYEAYAEMAEERMRAILAEVVAEHGLEAAAAEHRTGSVPLGEPSVIVCVSAGHRGEAFAGARDAIDRIKAEAPIWKQEVDGGESRWVEGAAPRGTGTRTGSGTGPG